MFMCKRKMLQGRNKNRGENVVLENVQPLKNKGSEFPRAHYVDRR